MGEVYEVRDSHLNESVALKTISPTFAENTTAIERFKREVSLARKVTHPNVCRIFDFGVHALGNGAQVPFLTMELLDGPTLASRPPDDPGAVARALIAFTLGAPRAVALAPADPRAENVVLLGDGIGLLGVGAARAVDRARAERGLEALGALRASDRTGFVAAVQGLALLPAEAAGDAYDLLDELIGDILRGPVRFDAVAVSDLIDRALAAVARALPLTERLTAEPADLWPLRMLVQLAALLGRLGATEDFCALALAAGRDGWA